jgi:hypothetical protein
MTTDKKFQVFVSSTYEDLQAERQEIMHALLELDCIPSGMELFPAANEDQWSLIKGVIDDCDYYLVVIGGRYGSIGATGISYTEMEYRYALEQSKPIIAFLHRQPDTLPKNKTEKELEGQKKLEEFRALAQKKMVKHWESAKDLGSVVSRSLIMLQRTHPGIGWVRGNLVPSKEASLEILALKKEIERLQNDITLIRTTAPKGTETLSQGDDQIILNFTFKVSKDYRTTSYESQFTTSWNDLFYTISPLMIDEAHERTIRLSLNKYVDQMNRERIQKIEQYKDLRVGDFELNNDDYQTIKVQMRALGLVLKSQKNRSVKDTGTYWALTPYGDEMMTQLRAIKK